jgi:transcription initiation factor TFIIIB Brf1 subunit/transcription initiation factor TFIIB
MSGEKLVHQKKCPNCGQWTVWNQSVEDICQHCGAVLDEEGLRRRAQKEEEKEKQAERFNLVMIEIYPTDGPFTVFYKRIIQAFQITFMAILSFIIWLVTILAG